MKPTQSGKKYLTVAVGDTVGDTVGAGAAVAMIGCGIGTLLILRSASLGSYLPFLGVGGQPAPPYAA